MNEYLENLKQKAKQLFDDKNWDELIPICTEIIELEKEPRAKARAYTQRGGAYRGKGDYDREIADFTKGLELSPNDADIHSLRGYAYRGKGDYDQAIVDFTKAIEYKPNDVLAYYDRGLAYGDKGDYDQEIADLTKALELEPDNAEAHYFRGLAYRDKGDYDQEIADFTKALELNPNYERAYLSRGTTYLTKGDLDRAIADFTKTLKPSSIDAGLAHLGRGLAYIQKENFPNAFDDLVNSGNHDPDLKLTSSPVYIASQLADIYKESEKNKVKAFELYWTLLKKITRIQEKQFHKPEEGAEVAHYTSLHTLRKLANEERFRFYNAVYMNDPEEGRVFFDIMGEHEINVKEDFYGEDEDPSYPSPAYIGSFVMVDSENQGSKDKLFLWRTYGKHNGQEAGGACLRYEGTCFADEHKPQIGVMQQLQSRLSISAGDHKNSGKRQHSKPALYKTCYTDKENNKELFEELDELAESLKELGSHVSKEDDNRKDRLKQLARELLDNIRFLFKASHYKEEREVRVIHCYYDENMSQEPDGINVDTEEIPPRFYLDANDSFRPDEVILGPKARGVREWTQWLEKRDIKAGQSEIKYGNPYFKT